ncbi:MAG: hypothetical protein DMD79_07790 [Candidatus Rokuibacteriota bacterium]|nr:MAG: hypothetical protein DMD79_07790 [Candidatus Rokubacteria bacterium]
MQSAGFLLTEASRIVIIILVIQLLGLGPMALAPGAHGIHGPTSDRDRRDIAPGLALLTVPDVSPPLPIRDLGPAGSPAAAGTTGRLSLREEAVGRHHSAAAGAPAEAGDAGARAPRRLTSEAGERGSRNEGFP